jgi:glyoxylase-like metal-dependent hydrolase (beta-lactamase superfamily II)
VLPEYQTIEVGGVRYEVLPTPGHTIGSLSFLAWIDGTQMAFTGDLIAGPGKVWSLAATQWSYNGIEGVGATWHSILTLRDRRPGVLLPSHGEPMVDAEKAIDLLAASLYQMILERGNGNEEIQSWWEQPYVQLTPHLLQNRTSVSHSYVLISDTGKALVIDFGYDFSTGLAQARDRSSRRPLLATLNHLKRDFGVSRVDVALPTHYHDDHVAGFNLLRDVEGTQIWAAATFSHILENPLAYDLPCLWYDPIPVDRSLPTGVPIGWEEYEISLFDLPGHTLYACAIAFQADGLKIVASGDQQGTVPGRSAEWLNYTYRSRFRHQDFRRSAELYRQLGADLLISGHWAPRYVDDQYLTMLFERGVALEKAHEALLPLETFDLGAEGAAAWIRPYRSIVEPGSAVMLEVEVRNPFDRRATAEVELVIPSGWVARPASARIRLETRGSGRRSFAVQVGSNDVRRARIACDVTVGGRRLGQVAEALVTVADVSTGTPLPVAGRTSWTP